MRIIQITDLHISREGVDTHGVDVRANFRNILNAIPGYNPDWLVLTGDFCFRDSQPDIYLWIKKCLDELGIPYYLITGNHDDSVELADSFQINHHLKGEDLYFYKELDGVPAIFMDTSLKNVSEGQLNWLNDKLKNLDGPVLLFIHHPPMKAGVGFMDLNHPLQNRQALQQILFSYPHPIHAFCGHYHVDKIISKNNLTVYITPATFFQIDPFELEFTVDHYRIGFRIIDVNGGKVTSTVRYLK